MEDFCGKLLQHRKTYYTYNFLSYQKEIGIIIKNLAKLQNLNFFEFELLNPMFYGDDINIKITIDKQQKIIKISQYFSLHCVPEMNMLREFFTDCCVIEVLEPITVSGEVSLRCLHRLF
jgi:hypothetical protein